VQDALANTLVSRVDLASMPRAESDRMLDTGKTCRFTRGPENDPILWTGEGGAAAVKLNGVLVVLKAQGALPDVAATFAAPGITVTLRLPGLDAD
jgi:hypothetical protein